MSDLDVKVEAPTLLEFVRIAARRNEEREGSPENTPAPDHKPQALALDNQRETNGKGSEPLAQEIFKAAPTHFLRAAKRSPGKSSLPNFLTAAPLKVDPYRHSFSRTRKTK